VDEPLPFSVVYYTNEFQQYDLVLDDWSAAYHYAEPEIRARLRRERLDELRTMPYREYLRTPEWAQRAEAAKAQAGFRCEVCYASRPLDAHHRTYERRGAEAAGDLTALCPACHALFHEHRDLSTTTAL
jgi:hypothetical protein